MRRRTPETLIDLPGLDPPPAGFPACAGCAYLVIGTPAICFACASAGAPTVFGPACSVCGQELVDGAPCTNTVCSYDDRWFSGLYTVSRRADDVWTALCRYKYDEDQSWAQILGRILVGFLEERRAELEGYDLITTGALYVGPKANRLWDHLRLVLDAAEYQGPTWPYARDLITKAGPTGQFLGRSPQVRRKIAEHSLRAALSVPEPERVAGRRILVLDDVYSEGFSMREMARALIEAGAAEVAGIVLARKKGG